MKRFFVFLFLFLAVFSGCALSGRQEDVNVSGKANISGSIQDAGSVNAVNVNAVAREDSEDAGTSVNTNASAEDVPQPATKTFETTALPYIDFNFDFRATIPSSWFVEYIPDSNALNIYDPAASGATPLEQSQIFVRYFKASDFLTLTTVNVYSREELTVAGRPAVRYDIAKKEEVTDFPDQPSWRNRRHFVTDVRSTDRDPAVFYVFGKRPELDDGVFASFLNSLEFLPTFKEAEPKSR